MDPFYGENNVPSSKEELAGLEKKWTPAEVVQVLLEHMDGPEAAIHKLVSKQPDIGVAGEAREADGHQPRLPLCLHDAFEMYGSN